MKGTGQWNIMMGIRYVQKEGFVFFVFFAVLSQAFTNSKITQPSPISTPYPEATEQKFFQFLNKTGATIAK